MTIQDEGDRRPMGFDYAATAIKKNMPSPEQIGAGAARRTLSLSVEQL